MFYAHYIGPGQGCGYYVGCNEKFELLSKDIKTMDEAAKYAAMRIVDYYDEDQVESFTIHEVVQSEEFDSEEIQFLNGQQSKKISKQEEQERLEYLRLKAKYEGD